MFALGFGIKNYFVKNIVFDFWRFLRYFSIHKRISHTKAKGISFIKMKEIPLTKIQETFFYKIRGASFTKLKIVFQKLKVES